MNLPIVDISYQEIKHSEVFCDWLLLLNIMFSELVHVIACLVLNSFLWLNNIPWYVYTNGIPRWHSDEESETQDTRDVGSIPGSKRWSPGVGNGYPLQYSCLGNSMDREAWWATVHRVPRCWIWLILIYVYTMFCFSSWWILGLFPISGS